MKFSTIETSTTAELQKSHGYAGITREEGLQNEQSVRKVSCQHTTPENHAFFLKKYWFILKIHSDLQFRKPNYIILRKACKLWKFYSEEGWTLFATLNHRKSMHPVFTTWDDQEIFKPHCNGRKKDVLSRIDLLEQNHHPSKGVFFTHKKRGEKKSSQKQHKQQQYHHLYTESNPLSFSNGIIYPPNPTDPRWNHFFQGSLPTIFCPHVSGGTCGAGHTRPQWSVTFWKRPF